MNPNITVDVAVHCNATCVHLYVDVAAIIASANGTLDNIGAAGDGTSGNGNGADLSSESDPLAGLNAAYEECMSDCSGNFTLDTSYLCDGGQQRREALVALEILRTTAEGGLGVQGITPQEQLEIDQVRAQIPQGELCFFVDVECVANNTHVCEPRCSERVAFYHELCVYSHTVRRNATFDYNISSCIHPDGWRVGAEKWRYYAGINETLIEAQPSYHRGDPLWTYADVQDETILNCSCHFLNETFDPEFVAAVIEYEMRPYRSGFISTCFCVYNETIGGPEHCVHSNFSNIASVFDWLFGNHSALVVTMPAQPAHAPPFAHRG